MTALPEDHLPSCDRRPLTIRAVTEADLPQLARADREIFREDAYPYFVLRQLFDLHGDRLLVLDDGESLYGYVLYVTTPDRDRSWILSLGVTLGQRGQGLGRRLMLEVLRRLRAEGVSEVRLTVEPGNDGAVLLYRSLGFASDAGPRKDYFGPGEDRLIMTLGL
ncbi:N-acetyltransferase family protein [Streptomyces sp. NPDC001393]